MFTPARGALYPPDIVCGTSYLICNILVNRNFLDGFLNSRIYFVGYFIGL